jgi:hypothetical protein
MVYDSSRSGQVVTAYKRHKFAISTLHQGRRILQNFERERALDRRLTWVGIAIIVAPPAFAALARLGVEHISLC